MDSEPTLPIPVLRDGGCLQPLEQFLALIKSYPDKKNVTIEAHPRALHMFTSTRSVSGYTTEVQPPADFIVGKTILGGQSAVGMKGLTGYR